MRLPLKVWLSLAGSIVQMGGRATRRIISAIVNHPENNNGRRVRFSYRKGRAHGYFPGEQVHPQGTRSRRAWQQCRRIKAAMRIPRKAANV